MSFLIYDLIFLAAFCAFVIYFLYSRRKRVDREGWIFLYRTKLGIKFIDYVSKRYKNFLHSLRYVVIASGYILMAAILYLFFQLLYFFAKFPMFVKAVKIPPIMPLVPYLPEIFKIDFLPPFYFTYWIIVIGITAVVHEFAHGIFARLGNIKVKTTGFAFFGPFFGAFVEPDEKKMKKAKLSNQLSILSAGTFSNIVLSAVFLIVIIIFFHLAFSPIGVIVSPASSLINISGISQINGAEIQNLSLGLGLINGNFTNISIGNAKYIASSEILKNAIADGQSQIQAYDDAPAIRAGLAGIVIEINGKRVKSSTELGKELGKYFPGDRIDVTAKIGENQAIYSIVLAENPNKAGKAYLGVATSQPNRRSILSAIYSLINLFRDNSTFYQAKSSFYLFVYDLLWWIIVINLSVGLVNMLPVGIFDGGRVFYLTIFALTKSHKTAKKVFTYMTYLILLVVILMMIFWGYSFFVA